MVLERRCLGELAKAGDLDKAVETAEKLVAWYRRHLGGADLRTLAVRAEHMALLVKIGEKARALELLPEVVTDFTRNHSVTPEFRSLIEQRALSGPPGA